MRFLHTSDWHLGRSFHGLSLLPDQEKVLAEIITIIKTKKIEVLLIAGDIYDRAVPPAEAVNLLNKTLEEIILHLHVPVILIAGNHDNPDRLNFGQALFAQNGLYIYSTATKHVQPLKLQDEYGPVYFAPLTYCEPLTATALSGERKHSHQEALDWQIEEMLKQIPANSRMVALSHAFVTGAQPTPDSERPLAVGGSTTVSLDSFLLFNYTALGHLHAAQKCSEKVRYCGSLLKYSFAEALQKKTVQLVELNAAGEAAVEEIPLAPTHDLLCLKGTFAELLAKNPADFRDKYVQLTLTDTVPILDAKHKLEEIYPHILELCYERLALSDKALDVEAANTRKLTTEELFKNFFTALHARDLNTEETSLLQQALNQLEQEGRNA